MKKIYTVQFVWSFMFVILGSTGAMAQGGVYFREGFENSTGWPTANTAAIPFQEVKTTTSGSFYTFGGYSTSGSTGSCPTQTGGAYHLRLANLSSIQPGYTVADSSFILTPLANAGIFNVTFFNGRTLKRITVYKTSDADPTTTNWVMVYQSSGANLACDVESVSINDANAKRLKIFAKSGGDSDIDSLVMTSVGSLPTKFGTMSLQQKNDDVIANWNAFNESNVRGYYLQRSHNGSSFEDVSFVQAKNALSADYSTNDKIKGGGVLYYRVKSVDFDGKEGFSPIAKISIDNAMANGIRVINPVRGNRVEVQLEGLEPGVYQVSINSISGGRLNTKSVNVQNSRVTVSMDLPATAGKGIQVLSVAGNRFSYAGKIVVE